MFAYLANLLILTGIAAILAASLNLVLGYAGIFSAAQAVFYGVGAYTAALVALHYTDSFLLATLVAMLVAAVAGLLLAVPALRIKEEYFVVASLGFQLTGYTIFSEWSSLTGGFAGLVGIPPARILGWQATGHGDYLLLTVLCALIVFAVLTLLVHSPLGREFKAIRDNESAALALGKNPVVLRVIAVSLGGALAAVGGSLYSFYIAFVNPESFTLSQSILFMAMVILGGAGTLVGPIIGAVFITVFPALLTFLDIPHQVMGPLQQIVYGLAMILLMIYQPDGLIGLWLRLVKWIRARRGSATPSDRALPGGVAR
ncbi:MAG TPA: branched-chain amino acid ABC transporter permease [Bacillota bacterium]